MDGIHLVNFHPNKIEANVFAIEEYNRLRTTISMEKLPAANIIPPLQSIFPKAYKRKTPATKDVAVEV